MEYEMAAKQKQYQVTAALATVKTAGGHLRYVYQDGVLPSDADPDHVKHLLNMEMIAEMKDVQEAAASEPSPDEKKAS
jgi:hypothetical protein